MRFRDRSDAGRRLAAVLARYKAERPVVLALPRGGVPVASEVAAVLEAPLDLILVRKIGHPSQPELAVGAVVDGARPVLVRNEDVIAQTGIDEEAFQSIARRELQEIERRRQIYLGDRKRAEVAHRLAIVVDDGIATGATTRAALRATRMRDPSKLVLAVPVAAPDTLKSLEGEADEIVCLEQPRTFVAVGLHYADFSEVTDEDVREALDTFPPRQTEPASEGVS